MNLSPTSAHRLSPPIITYMHSFEITYIRSNIFYHNFLQRIKHTLLLISKESNKPPANSTHEKEKLKFFIFLSKLEKKKNSFRSNHRSNRTRPSIAYPIRRVEKSGDQSEERGLIRASLSHAGWKERKERGSGCPTRWYFIIDTQTTKARLRDLTRGRRLFRIEANGISMRAAPFCIVILQYAYSIIGFSPPFFFLPFFLFESSIVIQQGISL